MARITHLACFFFALEKTFAQLTNLRGTSPHGGALVRCCPQKFDCLARGSDVSDAWNREKINYCRSCSDVECTEAPSDSPTIFPTTSPSISPTTHPTESPTTAPPTAPPTMPRPTFSPTTSQPTHQPTYQPTPSPTNVPTEAPTSRPTNPPTPHPVYISSSEQESSGGGGGSSEAVSTGGVNDESSNATPEVSEMEPNSVREGQDIGTEVISGSAGEGSEAKEAKNNGMNNSKNNGYYEEYYEEYYVDYYNGEIPDTLSTPLIGKSRESTEEADTTDGEDTNDTTDNYYGEIPDTLSTSMIGKPRNDSKEAETMDGGDTTDTTDSQTSPTFSGGYGFTLANRPGHNNRPIFGTFGAGSGNIGPGAFKNRPSDGLGAHNGRFRPFGSGNRY